MTPDEYLAALGAAARAGDRKAAAFLEGHAAGLVAVQALLKGVKDGLDPPAAHPSQPGAP